MTGLFRILAAASLTLALGPVAGAEEGPWHVNSADWVFAQGEFIDSWPGIYHDRDSGACVEFDVAFTSIVSPLPAPEGKTPDVEVGRSGGVSYRLKVSGTADELRAMRARMKREGLPAWALPKANGCPGGRRISVAFMPAGLSAHSQVWNAHADACSEDQYQRVRDFFLGPGRWPATDRRPATDGRLLAKSEIDAVAVGTAYEEVRAKLGAPSSGECGAGDGFTAEWTYKARPHWISRRFRFGRDHRLIAIR